MNIFVHCAVIRTDYYCVRVLSKCTMFYTITTTTVLLGQRGMAVAKVWNQVAFFTAAPICMAT